MDARRIRMGSACPSHFVRVLSLAFTLLAMAVQALGEPAVETIPCPAGSIVVGFTGWQGRWMEDIQGVCARIGADGMIDSADLVHSSRAGGTNISPRTMPRTVTCGRGRVVIGFAGERSEHVWDIHGIQCTDFNPARRAAVGTPVWLQAFTHRNQGSALAQFCLDGRVAVGMTVETGSGHLDHFNLICQFAPGATGST